MSGWGSNSTRASGTGTSWGNNSGSSWGSTSSNTSGGWSSQQNKTGTSSTWGGSTTSNSTQSGGWGSGSTSSAWGASGVTGKPTTGGAWGSTSTTATSAAGGWNARTGQAAPGIGVGIPGNGWAARSANSVPATGTGMGMRTGFQTQGTNSNTSAYSSMRSGLGAGSTMTRGYGATVVNVPLKTSGFPFETVPFQDRNPDRIFNLHHIQGVEMFQAVPIEQLRYFDYLVEGKIENFFKIGTQQIGGTTTTTTTGQLGASRFSAGSVPYPVSPWRAPVQNIGTIPATVSPQPYGALPATQLPPIIQETDEQIKIKVAEDSQEEDPVPSLFEEIQNTPIPPVPSTPGWGFR